MTDLRTLMVDDEVHALNRMATMLEQIEGARVVGRAEGGREAVDMIRDLCPDLVFLDIAMPGLDGFDVIETLALAEEQARRDGNGPPCDPLIVFVTAYPDQAARAFDSGAVDFLAKPVRLARLKVAIDRARAAFEGREAAQRMRQLEEQIEALRAHVEDPGSEPVWIAAGSRVVRVDPREIVRVQAEGEYIRVYREHDDLLHRSSLAAFIDSHGETLVRVHRSHAVAPREIASISRVSWGGFRLHLQSGAIVPVGAKYKDIVRRMVAEGPAPEDRDDEARSR